MSNSNGQPTTSVAIPPIGWRRLRLNEVAERISVGLAMSVTEYYCESGVPLIRNQNISDGWFDDSDIIYIQPTFAQSQPGKTIRAGDVLTVRTGANIGQTCVVPSRFAGSQSFTTLITTTKQRELVPEYLSFHLQSPIGRSEIERLQVGGGKGNLNAGHLEGYRIDVPPVEEQQCICQVLESWDRTLFTLPKLIVAKLRFKQGLMQQLLTGKRRFNEFGTEPWREYQLGDLFTEREETNCVELPLLSITAERGVIPRTDVDRKDTSNENKSLYKRIAPGDIGYNTMRMWQGVSAVSRYEGIVSPAYTICIPGPDIDADFAGYLFKYPPVVHLFYRFSQGLVDDTLNLKFHHFAQIRVRIPSVKEQRKIAQVFSKCDEEIEVLRKQLDALKQQKKGLMQKLLSGEVRVML